MRKHINCDCEFDTLWEILTDVHNAFGEELWVEVFHYNSFFLL